MEPLHNFDTDMLCTRLQFLSSAQKIPLPPPKKEIKKKKGDKSPFYSRDNMKRSEDLGVLVAVCTQCNKRAALTSSHSSACPCLLHGWLLPAANEQSFVCVVPAGRCTAPSGTRHWLPAFTGLCHPGLHQSQSWLRAVLCWDRAPEHPALSPGYLPGQLGGLCLPALLPLALTSWLEWHRGPHSW